MANQKNGIVVYLKRLLLAIVFLAGIVLIYKGLDYVVSDDVDSYTRVTFHDFYELDTVDVLFVGPSHTIYALDAETMSEDLGLSVFNLATSNQEILGSYYVLKDALVNHPEISHVYMEVSLSRLMEDVSNETASYIITDYLKSPVVRAQMLIACNRGRGNWFNGFFRLHRNQNPMSNLKSPGEIKDLIARKSSDAYRTYAGNGLYLGRGQWQNGEPFSESGNGAVFIESTYLNSYTVEDVKQTQLDYLQKMIDLCAEKDVEITLYSMPYTRYYLMYFEQYESIAALVHDIADRNGIDYLDLNIARDEYLSVDGSDFANLDHVSYMSDGKIAAFFEMYMADSEGDYFCENLAEKYPCTGDVVCAVFDRLYIHGEERDRSIDALSGPADSLLIELSALAFDDTPVDARLIRLEKGENGEWIEAAALEGENSDPYRVDFIIPYDGFETFYRIQLLSPETGDVLYEAVSCFDMP